MLVAAAVFVGAGCTGEDDLLDTWRAELGHPKALTSIDELDCREPLPSSLEHCALTVHVRRDISKQQVVALIDAYLDAARDVYAAKDFEHRIGALRIKRGSSSYSFAPSPGDSPLRRRPADAPLDFWIEFGSADDGAASWHVSDAGDAQDAGGSRATLELATTTPAEVVTSAMTVAPTLTGIDNAVISAPAPSGDPSNLTSLSLVLKRGVVPIDEWRFALAAAAREPDQPFTASISRGSVRFVAQLRRAGSSDVEISGRAVKLRDRMEVRAPQAIDFTIGYRVLR